MKHTDIKGAVLVFSIFFAVLSAIPLSNALDVALSAPSSIALNQEFSASISASVSEAYDVKIFIPNPASPGKTFSEVYDNGWKNSFNYIIGAFPGKTDYSVRAVNSSGDNVICARLRKTGSKSYSAEACRPISITGSQSIQQNSSNSSSQINEADEEEKEMQNKTASQSAPPKNEAPAGFAPAEKAQNKTLESSEKIILNPPSQKSNFLTKDGKILSFLPYVFILILIVIIILLSLKRL
jgi:hypothetical protein